MHSSRDAAQASQRASTVPFATLDDPLRSPREGAGFAFAAARHYLRVGLDLLAFSPWLYVVLLTLLSVPAALAALLMVSHVADNPERGLAIFLLNSISATVAPVVVMMAVAAGARRQRLGVAECIAAGLRWLPRYLWTNAHTTVMFWVPMTALVAAMQWQRELAPAEGISGVLTVVGWSLAIAALGLYIHTRTLLAPFYAVHGNMPGTLAALESWRVTGRYFWAVFGAFLVSAVPPALVPVAIYGGLLVAFSGSPEVTGTLLAMAPSLVWVGLQFVRPFLVATVYPLHRDLWTLELRRREVQGHPRTPRALLPLLAVSRALPRLAAVLVRRPLGASL